MKINAIKIMAGLLAIYGPLNNLSAQTLDVHTGSVTYQFPAKQCGEMTIRMGQH